MIKKILMLCYQTYLRRKYISKGVRIGSSTWISHKAYIDCHMPAKVIIGENCFITRNVVILNHTDTKIGGPKQIWKDLGGDRVYGDVILGNNVFIGVGSVVMPGVKIGDNAIIGALSVVTRDVPEGKIVAGNPARVIGNTFEHVKKK